MTKVIQKNPDLFYHREKPFFLFDLRCSKMYLHFLSPPSKALKLSSRSALINILQKILQSYHSQACAQPRLNSVVLFIADGEPKGISPLLTLGLLSK